MTWNSGSTEIVAQRATGEVAFAPSLTKRGSFGILQSWFGQLRKESVPHDHHGQCSGLRLKVMKRAEETGNVSEACRQFGISRTLFYRWRRRYLNYATTGLVPRPSRPQRWARQSAPELEHSVLAYALAWPTHGPQRIADQLARPSFGKWRVSASGVCAILTRHGLQTR